MRDNYNADWEEKMSKVAIPESTMYVKAKLSMELELYKASNSSISDSIRNIENPFAQSNDNNVGVEEKNNVRVRKLESPVSNPYPSYEPTNYNNSSSNNYYGGGYEKQDVPSYKPTSGMGGMANTLILLSTVALVLLVMVVSLYVMYIAGV